LLARNHPMNALSCFFSVKPCARTVKQSALGVSPANTAWQFRRDAMNGNQRSAMLPQKSVHVLSGNGLHTTISTARSRPDTVGCSTDTDRQPSRNFIGVLKEFLEGLPLRRASRYCRDVRPESSTSASCTTTCSFTATYLVKRRLSHSLYTVPNSPGYVKTN